MITSGFMSKANAAVWQTLRPSVENAIADWIVDTCQPFDVVSSSSFVKIFRTATQGGFHPPCADTFKTRITKKGELMDKNVCEYLGQLPYVGMLTDTWTANYQSTNFCGWIASALNMFPTSPDSAFLDYFALGLPRTPYEHDSEGLSRGFNAVCQEYGLEGRVSAVTTDSAAVNSSAFGDLTDVSWYVVFSFSMHSQLQGFHAWHTC